MEEKRVIETEELEKVSGGGSRSYRGAGSSSKVTKRVTCPSCGKEFPVQLEQNSSQNLGKRFYCPDCGTGIRYEDIR